ncbi:MAG TPA: MATE family efflux transporter [Allosphingosinicella sp.]|jgi:MATE family multidrug resistance protein|nr:MATE family efflux transporter [Allosphingosinicella sp.]
MDDNRTDTIAEARRILRLAWPIMLTSLNWTLMHMIDVVVVGHYGTAELAALGASRILTFIILVMGFAGLSGILVFTAQADGGKRLAETGDIFRAGLVLALVIGAISAAILGLFAFDLLGLFGVEPALQRPGANVVQAMALGFPAQLLIGAASYFLEGISRPRRVMAVNLVMLPFNGLLAWAWVGGHIGLPALGAVGAAYATATISWAGALAMILFVWLLPTARERRVHDFGLPALGRAFRGARPLARFGLVPAIGAMLELAGFSCLMVLSTQLGNAPAGAFQAMLSIHNIAFALSMGFGSAAGVRVGNAVGAGERGQAWPRALIAAALAALLLGLISLLLVFAAPSLVRPFSDDLEVLTLAAPMLAIMGAFLAFDGLQYVFGAALRSLGEQVWAGVNGIFGFFLITGGTGILLVRAGWGAQGLALAAGLGMLASALLQFGRFAWVLRARSGKVGTGFPDKSSAS